MVCVCVWMSDCAGVSSQCNNVGNEFSAMFLYATAVETRSLDGSSDQNESDIKYSVHMEVGFAC